MSRDAMVIVILVGFPVIVGGMATVIILLHRMLTSCECPSCFRRIPKDALKKSVPCPECGVEPGETGSANRTAQPNHQCRECESSQDCVVLWDGGMYCRTCIVKRSPLLMKATESNQLVEDMPYSIAEITWRMLLFASAVLGCVGTIVAVPVAIGGKWQEALQVLAGILLIGSPVILLWTVATAAAMPLMRIKVMAWNRQLIVRLGTRVLIAPLAECTWHEGKLSQMTVWAYAFLLSGPALIVELPKGTNQGCSRVAVGYTDDTLDLWKSFFEMAGVPRTAPKQSWWSQRRTSKAT